MGSDVIVGGKSSFALMGKLLELIPGFGTDEHCPVLAIRDEGIVIEKETCFQFARSIPGNTLISLDPHIDHVLAESEKPNKSVNRSGIRSSRIRKT
jgi:hypothetical protein